MNANRRPRPPQPNQARPNQGAACDLRRHAQAAGEPGAACELWRHTQSVSPAGIAVVGEMVPPNTPLM
jgi:hypothetical protein